MLQVSVFRELLNSCKRSLSSVAIAAIVTIRGTSRAAGLPRVDHFEGFSEVLCVVLVLVWHSAGQGMSGTCCIFHKISKAPQVVVERLFSIRELVCATSAPVLVGACLVVDIVRLPPQKRWSSCLHPPDHRTLPPGGPGSW